MGSKRRRALKAARLAAELARSAAEAERADETLAKALLERRAAAQAAALEGRPLPPEPRRPLGARSGRALLIINTKSGPNDDSILQLRPLVELLAGHGIDVDVRVKLRKRQARKEARAFAKDGCELVIAAGGDGTVQAIARGLIGTNAVLGIVPLGTYNNVAASLGIPTDMAEAVALIAAGPTRAVDVGMVRVEGRRKPKPFFEVASIGVAAALTPAGQEAKDGNWLAAAEALPAVTQMAPAATTLTLDREEPPLQAETLLVTVSNTPRAGAGLTLAHGARADDGLLDVAVYRGMTQGALALHFAAKATVGEPQDERIQRARARRVEVTADPPLPVAADSKVIGTTPARIKVLPGALRVVCGHGPGLNLPVSEALVAAATAEARRAAQAETASADGPGVGERAAAVAGAVASAAVTAVAEPVVAFVERRVLGQEAKEA
jgi:diacylglycerol kinase (ATP)